MPQRGFLYTGGTFAPIQDGTNSATVAWGINNAGLIVGGTGTVNVIRGFELRGSTFNKVSPPGNYVYVYATGVNNSGQIVGWTDYDGFAYINGRYTTIDFPGAIRTEALDINDSGVIVGWYAVGANDYAFGLSNGHYKSFGYPGALWTTAYAVNGSGLTAGAYSMGDGKAHGFMTNSIAPGNR